MRVTKQFLRIAMVAAVILTFAGMIQAEDTGKVDINKATVEELTSIKGIGESYAKRIVEYREKNGGFTQTEDIMKVKGIGAKKYESIKDSICVKTDKK